MFNRSVVLVCVATAFGALSAGCNVTNCEEGAICLDDEHRDSVTYECTALCRHLVDCGRVDRELRGECIDACLEGFERDHEALEDYCECSAESTCRELTQSCGRPPFTLPPAEEGDDEPEPEDAGKPRPDAGSYPEPDAGGNVDASSSADAGGAHDAGSSPDAGGSYDAGPSPDAGASSDADTSTPPDAAAGLCSHDDDCAASEGCLNGACHARCQASCECRLGDVCESGLCVTPPPATMSCQTDCDCPAGNQCIASVCSPRETTVL